MAAYDYLIVGCGFWGAVFAHQARLKGKRCLVIDRRPHRGGNLYCDMDKVIENALAATTNEL